MITSGAVLRINHSVTAQHDMYQQFGVLSGSTIAIERVRYPFPRADTIVDVINENWEQRYRRKFDQGFDTLLVVPGIVGPTHLQAALKSVILAHQDNITAPWNDMPLVVDTAEPVWGKWDDDIQYRAAQAGFPAQEKEWVDRDEFYRNLRFPGFDVLLIRSADAELKRQDEGEATLDRPDTEGGKTLLQHREMFGMGPYVHECALSTDGHLSYYMYSIFTRGVAPDVFGLKGTMSCASDNCHASDPNEVPCSSWSLDYEGFDLRFYPADDLARALSVRGAVRIY